MNKNTGWVKLYRYQFTHEISEKKPWCDGYAWSYLYSRANFKPGVVNFRNQYIRVERGQFVTSILKLSQTFGWTRKRTKAFLISLKNEGMILFNPGAEQNQSMTQENYPKGNNRRCNRFSIITICNYEKFQSMVDEEEATDGTTEGTTEGQQEHTNKNVKNVKKKIVIVWDAEKKDFSGITKDDVIGWEEAYPALDIQDQLLKAREWVRANPKNVKTNWKRFFVNWFNRAQDRARKKI